MYTVIKQLCTFLFKSVDFLNFLIIEQQIDVTLSFTATTDCDYLTIF